MREHILDLITVVSCLAAVCVVSVAILPDYFESYNENKTKTWSLENWKSLMEGGHRSGPSKAPIQIILFLDYQCSSCHQMDMTIDWIRSKYPNRVSVIRRHLPSYQHPMSYPSAIAAECAARHGDFLSFHNKLIKNHRRLMSLSLDSLARQSGIKNLKMFRKCIVNRKTSKIVLNHSSIADSLGVSKTPTIIVNGTLYHGGIKKSKLIKRLEDSL